MDSNSYRLHQLRCWLFFLVALFFSQPIPLKSTFFFMNGSHLNTFPSLRIFFLHKKYLFCQDLHVIDNSFFNFKSSMLIFRLFDLRFGETILRIHYLLPLIFYYSKIYILTQTLNRICDSIFPISVLKLWLLLFFLLYNNTLMCLWNRILFTSVSSDFHMCKSTLAIQTCLA